MDSTDSHDGPTRPSRPPFRDHCCLPRHHPDVHAAEWCSWPRDRSMALLRWRAQTAGSLRMSSICRCGSCGDLSHTRQLIERQEARPLPTEERIVKLATAVCLEADDLAIEHGAMGPAFYPSSVFFEGPFELEIRLAVCHARAVQVSAARESEHPAARLPVRIVLLPSGARKDQHPVAVL